MTRKCALTGVFAMFAALGAAAMPTKAEFQKVLPLVKELSAGDNAAVKAGTLTPKEAGDRALEYASDTSLDEASRYLFFEAAFAYYVSATEYDKAAEVVGKFRSEINDVPDAAVIEFIERRLRKVKREHAGRLYELLQDARTRSQIGAKIATYQKAVKANQGDTISQARLAYCQVLVRNWDEALKAFAKSDGEVAKMAQAELAGKGKSAVALGDFWWGFTINDYNFRNYAEQLAEEFKAHAATHYIKALKESNLSGVKRQVVMQRVGEDAAAAGGVRPVKAFDLGKGVKMEFIECPAGTFMMGAEPSLWKCRKMVIGKQKRDNTNLMYPHEVTITRPFWMSKYPVTIRQWSAATKRKPKCDELMTVFGPDSAIRFEEDDERAFIALLNDRFKGKIPKGYVVRYPTEAEFEYAFKANSTDENDLHRRIWQKCAFDNAELSEIVHTGDELRRILLSMTGLSLEGKECHLWVVKGAARIFGPVGKKKPNAWGFHDMMMGTQCLDLLSVSRSGGGQPVHCQFDLVYCDAETDPLRFSKTNNEGEVFRRIAYRPELGGNGILGFKEFRTINALRVVIGPDLMKEKGFDKE